MRARNLRLAVTIALTVSAVSFAGEPASKKTTGAVSQQAGCAVSGEYVEARTCDVWTGPCFANGEINLKGDHAVMAWVIRKGLFNNVAIDGLHVAAVIDSEGTLGTDAEGKVRAIVYVDAKASKIQQKALIAMATRLAPRLLKKIVRVERRKIDFTRKAHCESSLRIVAKNGKAVEVAVETTPLSLHCDVICGNEEMAYPTLAKTKSAMCAKTKEHAFRGEGLGVRWSDPGARSAMVGRFEI